MQRGVQVTQAFRNEIGKAVKTKRLTTGRTQKAFALEVGSTATTYPCLGTQIRVARRYTEVVKTAFFN